MLGHTILPKRQTSIKAVETKSKSDLPKRQAGYEKLFQQLRMNFKTGRAVEYLDKRNLDKKKIEVGYNSQTWENLKLGNLLYQGFSGNLGSGGDGFAAFGIGAVAGGVGAATGGASLAAMGTAGSLGGAIGAGALAGAAGGASAGFLQNTGNSLYFQNSSFGDALGSGLQGALWGFVGGAVFGGIAGGIGYKPSNVTGGTNAAATAGDDVYTVTNNLGVKIEVSPAIPSANQGPGGLDLVAARQTGLYTGPVSNISSLTQNAQATYINLVNQTRQSFGGNVTVMRNGRDLFRVHKPTSGHGLNVTEFQQNIRPDGASFINRANVPANQTHLNQLWKAVNGVDGFYRNRD